MKFQSYDLGNLSGSQIVQVTLSGNAANVRLMDSSNFQSYRSERQHRYHGGQVKRSPFRLRVPRAGHWYVTIDRGGYGGSVRSSVNVLPGALPATRESPLSSVPSLVQGTTNEPPGIEAERDFDVFISHASEDKIEVVGPLASALQQGGLDFPDFRRHF